MCFIKVRKPGIQVINLTVSNKLVLFNYIIRKRNDGKWIALKKTINMYKQCDIRLEPHMHAHSTRACLWISTENT